MHSLVRRALPCCLVPVALLLGSRDSLGAQSPPNITLRLVLDSAIARYPELGASFARVEAARGARGTAGAFGNPILAYQVDNARFPGGPAVTNIERENMTTATLPLEPLYQRRSRVRRADAEVRAAEADARMTRQQVALDAAHAFYRTALAQVSTAAANDLAEWLDSLVTYNRTRVIAGAAAEADLLRSELERDRASADATIQQADLVRAQADLAIYLGDVAVDVRSIVVALDDAPLADDFSDSAAASTDLRAARLVGQISIGMDSIVSRRPDVSAASERVVAARAGTAAEQSMIIRQLGATFGIRQSAGVNSMIAGISLPLPLFDQNRGELARSRAEGEVATFELATRRRFARASLIGSTVAARLLSDRSTLLARRDTLRGSRALFLARADEARAISLGAYQEGAVPLLQVLDAARAWGEAQTTFYRTIYAQHVAVLELMVARGEDLATRVPSMSVMPGGRR